MAVNFNASLAARISELDAEKQKMLARIKTIDAQILGLREAEKLYREAAPPVVSAGPAEPVGPSGPPTMARAMLPAGPQTALSNAVVIRPAGEAMNQTAKAMEFIEAAGASGLTVPDVLARLAALGVQPNRGTIASQLSKAKSNGRLEFVDGRYKIPRKGDAGATTAPANPDRNSN